MSDLSVLLEELRQAGREPDREVLDRIKALGSAAVAPLIALATDPALLDTQSEGPEIWAPVHAIRLLGELGAPEAVGPLLPLFDRVRDDALVEALPAAFGGIGPSAVAPLRALLFDRSRDTFARTRAADSLGKIGQHHPGAREEAMSALVDRLNPDESRTPEDEIIVAFAISALGDLKAVEALPAIRRAFEDDRVDTSVVHLDDIIRDLGLPMEGTPEPRPEKGLRLRLTCTACRRERDHHVETIYCDLGTLDRKQKGKDMPYSEFVIPRKIVCPKCGAEDQYELSAMAYIALMAETLKRQVAHEQGLPKPDPEDGGLQFIRFGLKDGREMHPTAALDLYRRQVAARPNDADVRVRFGNVLRFLGRLEEATEQYQAALRLDRANLEALYNLGQMAAKAGDRVEALRMFTAIVELAPGSRLSRKEREQFLEGAVAGLEELVISAVPTAAGRVTAAAPATRAERVAAPQPPARVGPKVGRNDPCPCGSGKKYKKCHGA